MHRLRKTAIALALGETVALGSSSPASAQPAAQPAGPEASASASESSRDRADPGAPAGSSTAGSPKTPSNVSGGYTWRTPAPQRKSGHRHVQKVDPSRPQAKGPEFVIGADGTSHISVPLSQRVEVSLSTHPGHLIFELPTAQVAVPNDSNPLVTTHFATPVKSVRLAAHGKSARLLIELRESTSPSYQMRQLPNGAASLEISLPKPSRSATAVRAESRSKAHSKASKPRK